MNDANRQNGHMPPHELRDWFALRSSVLPKDLVISGQSLKYFRGGIADAVCTTEDGDLEALASAFESSSFPELSSVRRTHGEVKLITRLEDEEYHLMIRSADHLAAMHTIGIDRLTLPLDAARWQGSPEDLADLQAGVLRWLRPRSAMMEDAFRLGAFAAMLDFDPHADTMTALREACRANDAADLDKHFLRKQFQKLVLGRRPSRGFEVLREIAALDRLLPELAAGLGLAQNRYHRHDIYYHSIYACDAAERDIALRLAALFHDLCKVDTRIEHANGEASFHNHEIVSTRHTENIMRRLAFPGQLKKRVKFLVRNHMFHYTDAWSDRAVRRFMKRVSMEQLEDLISLRLADRKGSGKRSELPRAIKTLIRHIQQIKAREAELKIKDLAIDGHRLQAMGVMPGPSMGVLLKDLLEAVKAERLPNEAEALEDEVRRRMEPAVAAP